MTNFRRVPPLTSEDARYVEMVRDALSKLGTASERLSASAKTKRPRLGVMPGFASSWLINHLRGFHVLNLLAIVAMITFDALFVGRLGGAFTAGYNTDSASNDRREKNTDVYGDLLNRYQSDDRDVLRMRADATRNRLWVLTLENVHVYDTAGRMLLRRIRLPEWSVADFDYALPPDIALDHRGTAFISNNVEPRLLEIDPSTFRTKEHQLRLTSRKHWETGFGSLQFARDGTLLAVSTTGGAAFRIDLGNGNAQETESTSH